MDSDGQILLLHLCMVPTRPLPTRPWVQMIIGAIEGFRVEVSVLVSLSSSLVDPSLDYDALLPPFPRDVNSTSPFALAYASLGLPRWEVCQALSVRTRVKCFPLYLIPPPTPPQQHGRRAGGHLRRKLLDAPRGGHEGEVLLPAPCLNRYFSPLRAPPLYRVRDDMARIQKVSLAPRDPPCCRMLTFRSFGSCGSCGPCTSGAPCVSSSASVLPGHFRPEKGRQGGGRMGGGKARISNQIGVGGKVMDRRGVGGCWSSRRR